MTQKHFLLCTLLSALLASTFGSSTFGFTTTISQANGNNSDAFANGKLLSPQGVSMADWSLSTTVRNNDFDNDVVQGGLRGLQYVMMNEVENSADSNAIRFAVTPVNAADEVKVTLSQSPYTNSDTWNGGDTETSQFFLTWTGIAGQALINDPLNQLNVNDGEKYNSPLQVKFNSNRARNNNDAWSIEFPSNAREVQVNWESSNPESGSSLTNEWVTFAASVTSAVPEPSSAGLIAIAALAFMSMLRRR